ncbi:MAG: transglutaminase domain-containing protein [Cyclobacteriaceae bacterium]
MKKLLLSFALLFLVPCLYATDDVLYDKIDAHARNAPDKLVTDLDKLTAYLIKPAANEREKVRAFYVWISQNISYDVDLFRRYRPGVSLQITPADVLKQKKAVCQGYSDLLKAMCEIAGIEARVIPGYSKGFGNQNRTDFSNADHAWNAVRIGGEWQLIDATWGAGGLDEKMKYISKFNDKYFLSAPEEFVKDHMPLYPMWQLLDCPVSMRAFAQGDAAIEKELSARQKNCIRYRDQIEAFDQMSEAESMLKLAEAAYVFNPGNHVVMARGYMDFAHYMMSGIKRELRSREEIAQAVSVQEEALKYLKMADSVLGKVRDNSADMEKSFVSRNIKNSEQNLQSMKKILKG